MGFNENIRSGSRPCLRDYTRRLTKYANVLNETKARLHFKLYF